MEIDHIFIFTDPPGSVADQLVEFGCREGSNRIHHGQGTANRKFYFDNFFLEVLWVHDQDEITSEAVLPTGLWKRAPFADSGASPFGLCLINQEATQPLFEKAYRYQPSYFPQGMAIDVLHHDQHLHLPWTFQLPFKKKPDHSAEPTNHPNGIASLTCATFEITDSDATDYRSHLPSDSMVRLQPSHRNWLTLTFDNAKQKQQKEFVDLQLTISY